MSEQDLVARLENEHEKRRARAHDVLLSEAILASVSVFLKRRRLVMIRDGYLSSRAIKLDVSQRPPPIRCTCS